MMIRSRSSVIVVLNDLPRLDVPGHEIRAGGKRLAVAGSISWEQLRELAAFRSTRACALSVYLGLDASDVPTPADVAAHVHSLLGKARERGGSARDVERIARWFDEDFSREGAGGVAVFASDADDFFLPL